MAGNITKNPFFTVCYMDNKTSQTANRMACNSWIKPVAYRQCKSSWILFFLLLILPITFSGTAEAYTITTIAGTGGSISPSGAVSVNQGDNITFTITPDNGYIVSNIHTAGTSQGAASSYTYYLVKTDSTLRAYFLPEANLIAETIYVDNTLPSDCLAGEYSVANRDNSGSDGNAYNSILEAANVAGPGDTVLIRAGTYNSSIGNGILWPKHSGTTQNPIVFKPYNSEQVIIGDGVGTFPNDNMQSIARGVISMRNVSHIEIEGLIIRNLAGWLFARNCSFITIKNCWFESARSSAKGGARLIECDNFKIINNTFHNSSYDSLVLVESDYNLIENNTFSIAAHSLLALRSASFNVIRENDFSNSYYKNNAAEKLTEVFDQKLDTRDSRNPSYIPVPGYNGTQHNVFENNLFGYHPDRPSGGARTSAMQFSGQSTIIRNNVFSNPPLTTPDPDYPNGVAGGIAIKMRWGGSWTGWNGKKVEGEGHESGYVSNNRIYNNVFYGYDNGKVTIPTDDAMNKFPDPPPMKNVQDYYNYPYSETYSFEDNIFKNNIFSEGSIVPKINWTYLMKMAGKPVQIIQKGRLDTTYFENNNFFSSGQYADQLIYDGLNRTYGNPETPDYFNTNYTTYSGNIQQDPLFVDAANNDFQLQFNSPMIDAGDFLTVITNPSGSGNQITVTDVRYFYDGYGIAGEQGDLIRLENGQTAQILDIDYSAGNDIIILDRQISWSNGEKVSLYYQGSAPDIGAYEGSSSDPNNPSPVLQTIGDKSVDENVILTFNIIATDPNNEPITYSTWYLPNGATFSGQTFSWTPTYSQAGSYSVRFIASDGNSSDSETITITVNNFNRAPVLGAISDQSVNENALLNFSVNATDPDGQTLIYSVTGLPSGAVLASQTFAWTPAFDQAGTFALTFTVDDGQAQDSKAMTITVNNVNRAPVFSSINNKSVWSDDPLTFTVNATDPDGDAVIYSANAIPSGSTFITQTFDWTPTSAQIGNYNTTFYASDGQLQDSEAVTISVNVDSLAPTVTNLSPAAGAIQVPLNNLITLNITDAGKGIEPKSVKIKVKTNDNPNNTDVYFGDLDHDISPRGGCRRIGNNNDYKFIFQPTQDLLYYDQTVTITLNATDLAGNIMNPYIYSFVTEMHLFGQNTLINTISDDNDKPATVCDSNGNIWAAWHTGSAGNRDIYIGTLAAGANNFGSTTQITNDATDQCNPALALDSSDKLYTVWQDNREGDWDIYISTSVDGINWSTETRVNDPNNGNQINPAIVVDGQSPNYAHVVWQDDRAGNQDICIAASSDGYITKTVSQITSNISDQIEPAVTVDSANRIYVVWTDSRNGSSDIYGAASNNGPWTNVAVVSNVNNQSSPVIVAESTGSILHFLWIDDTPGDDDIYYASSNNGLPGSPMVGSSIIDDTSGANQLEPTIAITGTTSNNDLKVFASWQDWRNPDTDLYFTELNSGSGTNVFVNDGGSGAYQSEPAIGINEYGYPYLIWADDRSNNTDIYFTGSTGIEPVALASASVDASALTNTTVGVNPQAITNVDDVSIVLPSGSCSYDVDVSIVKISNQQAFSAPCFGSYEFGPSGVQFNQPVTITIPYIYANSNGSTVPYWFNSLTGTLSQQGITNVRDVVISPTLHAISFETTHFTPFYLLGGGGGIAGALGGGGGGGGCSVSAGSEGNIIEFAIPYIVLVVVMVILKKRDVRYRKLHST